MTNRQKTGPSILLLLGLIPTEDRVKGNLVVLASEALVEGLAATPLLPTLNLNHPTVVVVLRIGEVDHLADSAVLVVLALAVVDNRSPYRFAFSLPFFFF